MSRVQDRSAEAHRRSVQASIQDVTKFVEETLGRRLVAHMVNVSDPKTVGRWATGERRPRPQVEQHLRAIYQVFQLLQTEESPHTVRACVDKDLRSVSDALNASLPLTPGALQALQSRCSRRMIDAKRLDHIAGQRWAAMKAMSRQTLVGLLRKRGLDRSVKGRTLDLAEDDASDFLDIIEGRLFNDDVTGEEKRADAYSARKR